MPEGVRWLRTRRLAIAILLGTGAGLAPHGTAAALTPPTVDSGSLPSAGPVAPPVGTTQDQVCAELGTDGADLSGVPAAISALDIPDAWRYSTGQGQRVAVIDTGVNPSSRLDVVPGGDYVSDGDGTQDCDGHGTAVASIIAAHRSDGDGFSGVAPDATIIAIRQSSPSFRASGGYEAPGWQQGFGSLDTLGRAVMQAVDHGATVINISLGACLPAGADFGAGDASVGAAIKYAFEQNVVVVAAAGNVTHDCVQNPGLNAADPSQPWANVISKVSPAWYDEYLLTVGSIDPDGAASPFSLAGPWVSVAAPGTNVVALDAKPGSDKLVNGETVQGRFQTLQGTSFAAGYVSGVAALIRARFPEMSAKDVIERIERTAHAPGTGRDQYLGFGVIDPVTALTVQTTPKRTSRDMYAAERVTRQLPGPPIDLVTVITAVLVGLGSVAAVAITFAVVPAARRFRRIDDD